MKKSEKIIYRQKSLSELQQQLFTIRKQLVEAKIKQSSGKLKNTAIIKKLKYQISLILTLITQKQNENQKKK